MTHIIICDCTEFYKELLNSSKEILSKEDGISQCKLFKEFLKKYLNHLEEKSFDNACSIYTCYVVISTLDGIRHRDMILTPLLLDLMTILISKPCAIYYVHRLWDFGKTTSFSKIYESRRVICALRHRSDFMKLMLNFGLISSLPSESPRFMKELEHEFSRFMLKMTPNISPTEYSKIEYQTMGLVKNTFFRYENSEYRKRMFLALMAIQAIEENRRNDDYRSQERGEAYITCLRMYFAGVRDTFLTVFEVRSILYISFKLLNKLHLFDIYCQEFDKLMPECPVKMEPRSLTDLVRYHIRQNLNVSGLPLPSAIDMLFLPKLLKSFLLGDILNIKQNIGGNCPSQKSVTQRELELLMSELSIH